MNDTQQETVQEVYVNPAADVPKALKIPATIISYVFHPVFMPLIMAIALYKLAPLSFAGITPAMMSRMVAPIFINTVMFPLLAVVLLKAVGFIKSIQMHDAKDRIIPLIATMIFYFWEYLVVKNQPSTPLILKTLILGSYLGIIIMFLVGIFYKVSMHTTAAGGMLGILIVLMMIGPINMQVPLFVAIVIAGAMGTARLILKAHTPAQVWLGYVLGIIAMVGAYLYLK